MSICRGVGGVRGHTPIGIFIHNGADSQNANTVFYQGWLQTHDLSAGFAHYYVADDGILQAEDDSNIAWHCGQTDGNTNYLSIEVCQSMGDLDIFKSNEAKALKLAADKCKQYGIAPSPSTIRLHQEVYATACPHRSVEIHGGADATKAYFINRIKELMNNINTGTNNSNNINTQENQTNERKETTMQCFYSVDGKGPIIYFDGRAFHPLSHPDEMSVLNMIYKENNGKDMPCFSWQSIAPWYKRLNDAVERVQK